MTKKYYITTSIPYANADPHVGFVALELLKADIMARYQRLLGNDVYFLTGTDEHGQKMFRTAKEAGEAVEKFSTEKSAMYQNIADQWNISNDDFIRTTEERHIKGAQKFWEASLAKGDIYKKKYAGLYCVGCESFKTEKDLVDGKCPDHNIAPEKISEENYFFKLSKYQRPLEKLFKERPDFVYPKSRANEMKSILKNGLEDISISRVKQKLSWGVPVPGDGSQVMYVWFDALTNYVTALGWGSESDKLFKKYWPADAHVVGKDINRFHSLLWPAMLMSAGIELPEQIAVHGFIYVDGQKMSKTIGNVIDPDDLTKKYPLDSLRYFFAREIPFEADGDFSYAKFEQRYNADLANGIGNLANRILTMIEKYAGSEIPGSSTPDKDLIGILSKKIWPEYEKNMSGWAFDKALAAVWSFMAYCDQQITERQPWALAKNGKLDEVTDMLARLSESLRHVAVMIWPIMPETAEKILAQLGFDVSDELSGRIGDLQKWGGLPAGQKISKPQALFPRL